MGSSRWTRPDDRTLGRVTVLTGERNGKYPHGNSLLVQGAEESLIVDPSLSMISRRDDLPAVDRVVNSHCHEDHIAGNHLFADVPWHVHRDDARGLNSLADMMAIYGYEGEVDATFAKTVVEEFHYMAKPDAVAYADGDVFDLGGARVRVIHTPGHTRGHSCLHCEPDDVLYLGDIDLSSFGPYYGDAWSDLEDFERSIAKVRAIDARWYATFHHIGVLEGREAFLARLDRFAAVIADRERRLLEFLAEPRSLDDVARHRFVYRPHDPISYAEPVERRSMGQHVARLVREGRVEEVGEGKFVAVTGGR